MHFINLEFYESANGDKNFNIRDDHNNVGEWTTELVFVPLDQVPTNLACFSLETWLTKIKPKLKEGARQYRDTR